MQTLKSLFILLAFIGLLFIGCSEKSSPVASPADQAVNSPGESMSLGKITVKNFTGREDLVDYLPGDTVAAKDNRVVGKGVWFESSWTIDDGPLYELLNGAVVDYTFNASFNISGEGPMQGKFTMAVGGGTLEGTVEGKMFSVTEDLMQGTFKYVGQGKGGSIDGMKLFCTETYYESKSYGFWPYGDLVGFIK